MKNCYNLRFNYKLTIILDKPRCFFVQACRGTMTQSGVPHDSFLQRTYNYQDNDQERVNQPTIPLDANLLLVYATTPGTYITTYILGGNCRIVPIGLKNLKQFFYS